jgi:hypothetical protein
MQQLPPEIWSVILTSVVGSCDILTMQYMSCVSKHFHHEIQRLRLSPQLYFNQYIQNKLNLRNNPARNYIVSVRFIYRHAGQGSAVVIELKHLMKESANIYNMFLVIVAANQFGWYNILRVFWKQ